MKRMRLLGVAAAGVSLLVMAGLRSVHSEPPPPAPGYDGQCNGHYETVCTPVTQVFPRQAACVLANNSRVSGLFLEKFGIILSEQCSGFHCEEVYVTDWCGDGPNPGGDGGGTETGGDDAGGGSSDAGTGECVM